MEKMNVQEGKLRQMAAEPERGLSALYSPLLFAVATLSQPSPHIFGPASSLLQETDLRLPEG